MKTAIVTGITGQDGAYLSELLLSEGWQVTGVMRRSSTDTTGRLAGIKSHPSFRAVTCDITDSSGMTRLIGDIKPDHLYLLAAQSHVAVSFTEPLATMQTDAVATMVALEAVRQMSPSTRVYFAATSELFGDTTESPQNEQTRLWPSSPYGIAKLASFHAVRLWREAYGLFAANGILFNHESVPSNSPVVLMLEDGQVDIVPIVDMFRTEGHIYEGILDKYVGCGVWTGDSWTKIVSGSCYKDVSKSMRIIQTRRSCCETTLDHSVFMLDNSEKLNRDIVAGDELFACGLPSGDRSLVNNVDFCKFLGFVVGDGHIARDGNTIRLTGTDPMVLSRYRDLLVGIYGFGYISRNTGVGNWDGCTKDVHTCTINCDSNFGKWLRGQIYTQRGNEKRIPRFILNADVACKEAFFDGYYDADGRKAGNERYARKGWTTSSATLCLGLIYLLRSFSCQEVKCKCECRDNHRYYYVQLSTPTPTNKGAHLRRFGDEVIKISNTQSVDGWFFDLQTESQTFATGANLCKVHNSPRRGLNFVTRKITRYVAQLAIARQNPTNGPFYALQLGNLHSRRDWGHAKDYVRAMHAMLCHDVPMDFVIATGQTRSIRDLLTAAFSVIGVHDWKPYVITDTQDCVRPQDVGLLLGDASLAKRILGWEPTISFGQMIGEMVQNDIEELQAEARANGG